MAYKEDLSIAVVAGRLKIHSNALLDAIDVGYSEYLKLTDAQGGVSDALWARVLFALADTNFATLTVVASAKTISCLTGANLFANFRVGRDIQLSGFTNGGNNQTEEIKTVTDDMITLVDGATGLVDETDTNARGQESASTDETAIVTAAVAAKDRFKELKDALDNVAVSTADRRADLMDWVW